MLFTAIENNMLISCLVKEHQVFHSSSPSLMISINSNSCAFACAVVENIDLETSYSTWICFVLYDLLDPTPCAIFPVHHLHQCFN